MSIFNVVRVGMDRRRLTDSAIEALIAGDSVVGAPAQLTEMVASLRNYSAALPDVPVSGALKEFIVDGSLLRPPVSAANTESAKRTKLWFAKVAAAVGAVPAQLLLGTTVAVAAVGGVYVLSGVDRSHVPDPRPPIETPEPSTTVPVVETPGRGVPVVDSPTHTPPTNPTGRTLPDQANVEGTPGCENGQAAAGGTTPQVAACDHGPPENVGNQSVARPKQPQPRQGRTPGR